VCVFMYACFVYARASTRVIVYKRARMGERTYSRTCARVFTYKHYQITMKPVAPLAC